MKNLLFLFALIGSINSFAQKTPQQQADSMIAELPAMPADSLKGKTLASISVFFYSTDLRQAIVYAKQGLELSKAIKWKRGVANFNNNLGLMIGDSGNAVVALQHFEESYKANLELDSKLNLVNNLNNIGRIYQKEGKYEEALNKFLAALKIAEQIKNDQKLALVYTNLISLYSTQKNYSKALEFARRALNHAELAKSDNDIAKTWILTGSIYAAMEDTLNSSRSYDKSLEVYRRIGSKQGEAEVLSHRVALEKDPVKALASRIYVQKYLDSLSPAAQISIVNLANIAKLYLQFYKLDSSKKNASVLNQCKEICLRTIALSKQANIPELEAEVSHILSEVEEYKGNYKAALDYHKRYNSVNDSVYSQDTKNKIANLQGEHDLSIKDQEIAINKISLESQRKTQIGLILGLVLLATIGGLLIWQNRTRKKTNTTLMVLNSQLDEANKIKARFFAILSHDLRSPVANLVNFLHLQKSEPGMMDAAKAGQHQERITQAAESLLGNMESMLLWSKGQMESFKPEIAPVAVSDLFEYTRNFFANTSNVAISFSDPGNIMLNTDENYLQTIMQNLTANAIKAMKNTANPSIHWMVTQEGDKISLSITDNGPGVQEEQVKALYDPSVVANSKTGLGLHLVRDLAKAIKCQISIQSKPGAGTTFTLAT